MAKFSRIFWGIYAKHIYAALAICLVLIILAYYLLGVITRHSREFALPSFENLTIAEANILAKKRDLRIEITDSVYQKKLEPGVVYKQNPVAGSKVKKNRRVLLTINAMSPKKVTVPNLVGLSLRQAQSELASEQLKVGRLIYEEDIATNNVLRQLYKGSEIEPGREIVSESEIDLVLGMNKDNNTTYIPKLAGITYSVIKEYLLENSLNIGACTFDATVKDYKDTMQAFVYKQNPPYYKDSTILMGSVVSLYFTLNRELIKEGIIENNEVVDGNGGE